MTIFDNADLTDTILQKGLTGSDFEMKSFSDIDYYGFLQRTQTDGYLLFLLRYYGKQNIKDFGLETTLSESTRSLVIDYKNGKDDAFNTVADLTINAIQANTEKYTKRSPEWYITSAPHSDGRKGPNHKLINVLSEEFSWLTGLEDLLIREYPIQKSAGNTSRPDTKTQYDSLTYNGKYLRGSDIGNLIIFDDVYTLGSTAKACYQKINESPFWRQVDGLFLAKTEIDRPKKFPAYRELSPNQTIYPIPYKEHSFVVEFRFAKANRYFRNYHSVKRSQVITNLDIGMKIQPSNKNIRVEVRYFYCRENEVAIKKGEKLLRKKLLTLFAEYDEDKRDWIEDAEKLLYGDIYINPNAFVKDVPEWILVTHKEVT